MADLVVVYHCGNGSMKLIAHFIQAEVVSSWLAPTRKIGHERPRQVVDNLQKQWAHSQLY